MGKKIKLEDPGPRLTPEQISEFEKELGGRLPEDYRRFLLDHNGGRCKPLLGLPWAGSIHQIGGFHQLLPANEDSGVHCALRHLREVNRAEVQGYLPIAGTWSECEICLAYEGKNRGGVFFTAYKYKIARADEDLVPIDVTMVPLADSFTGFLEHLVEIPEFHCPIEELGERYAGRPRAVPGEGILDQRHEQESP